MDDFVFWASLCTAVVGMLTFVVFRVIPALRAPEDSNSLLHMYEVTLPDRQAFEKHMSKPPPVDASVDKKTAWHAVACSLLSDTAKQYLKIYYQVEADATHYMIMKQNPNLKQGVSDQLMESTKAALHQVVNDIKEVERIATSLRPGWPGWGSGIFQQTLDEVRASRKVAATTKKTKKKPADDEDEEAGSGSDEEADEDAWAESRLRFSRGMRVKCNMGPKGFRAGTVVGDWRLPYIVQLDDGTRCNAPRDVPQLVVELPESEDEQKGPVDMNRLRLWNPLRFGVESRVMINMAPPPNPPQWHPGTVMATNWRHEKMPPNQVAAYQVRLDTNGNSAACPIDHPNLIKAAPNHPSPPPDVIAAIQAVAAYNKKKPDAAENKTLTNAKAPGAAPPPADEID